MTEGVRDRLSQAGINLPEPPEPAGAYVPAVRAGDLVFTAGQLPVQGGSLLAVGLVGTAVSLDVARDCARAGVINALAAAATVCALDDVVQVVKMTVYVASGEGFTEQPAVADAASELLVLAFGEAGRHAREAVGVAILPRGVPVELSLVLRVS